MEAEVLEGTLAFAQYRKLESPLPKYPSTVDGEALSTCIAWLATLREHASEAKYGEGEVQL